MRNAEFTPPHVVKRITEAQDIARDARADVTEREARMLEPLAPAARRAPDAVDVSFAQARIAQWVARIAELREQVAYAEERREQEENNLAALRRGEWPDKGAS